MAVWPASLQQRLNLGSGDVRQQGFIRTAVDAGPTKQRKRYTAASRFLSGTMFFTAAQKATYDTFYETTINEGSEEFDFIDPADLSTVSVRIVSVPVFTAIKTDASGIANWQASLQLEILP